MPDIRTSMLLIERPISIPLFLVVDVRLVATTRDKSSVAELTSLLA